MGAPLLTLGVNLTEAPSTTEKVPVGSVVIQDNAEFVYLLSAGTIAAKRACVRSGATGTSVVESGNGGFVDCVSLYAVASGEYGWFQTRGVITAVNVGSGVTAGASLARDADTNGDLDPVAAATGASRGRALTAHSGGTATVLLY